MGAIYRARRPITATHIITGERPEPRPATRVSEEPLGGLQINRAAQCCLNVPAFLNLA
jgi:hypothetical protein